jgi:hypothetical protein
LGTDSLESTIYEKLIVFLCNQKEQNEKLEKDTMWTARKLGLSAGQEDRMRTAFQQVEQVRLPKSGSSE